MRKFPRLEKTAYEVIEIWSKTIAQVDKLGKKRMEQNNYWFQWTFYQEFYVLYQCDQKILLTLLELSKS